MLVRDDSYFTTHINLNKVTCVRHQKNDDTYYAETSDCEVYEIDRDGYERIVKWVEARESVSFATTAAMRDSIREPVVRCRDCKEFLPNATPHDSERPNFCRFHGSDLADTDGFCAWGERMEEQK